MWSCCIWCFGRFVNISATSHRTHKRFAASDSPRKSASFKPKIIKFHPQFPILHFPLLLPSTLHCTLLPVADMAMQFALSRWSVLSTYILILRLARMHQDALGTVELMVFCWGAQNVSYLRHFFCVFYAVFAHRSGIQFAFKRAQDHNIPSTGSKVP